MWYENSIYTHTCPSINYLTIICNLHSCRCHTSGGTVGWTNTNVVIIENVIKCPIYVKKQNNLNVAW